MKTNFLGSAFGLITLALIVAEPVVALDNEPFVAPSFYLARPVEFRMEIPLAVLRCPIPLRLGRT